MVGGLRQARLDRGRGEADGANWRLCVPGDGHMFGVDFSVISNVNSSPRVCRLQQGPRRGRGRPPASPQGSAFPPRSCFRGIC